MSAIGAICYIDSNGIAHFLDGARRSVLQLLRVDFYFFIFTFCSPPPKLVLETSHLYTPCHGSYSCGGSPGELLEL